MRKVKYTGTGNKKLVYNDKVFKPAPGEEYPLNAEMEEVTATFPDLFEEIKDPVKKVSKKKKKSGGSKR